jgi:ABC-type sugar transport system ATPase subunit
VAAEGTVLDGGALMLLEIDRLSKRFGATQALDEVSLSVEGGRIRALIGENGAGKSTLIKMLCGIHAPDAGTIRLDGRRLRFKSPAHAIAAGVVLIPQELRVVPALSVAENMLLGQLPERRLLGVLPMLDRPAMRAKAEAIRADLGLAFDIDACAGELSFAERQLVVIGRALGHRTRVLILDEPTASLERREVERLFAVLRRLCAQGVAIIYISHRLEEVAALADSCTVLRDGRVVAQIPAPPFDMARLTQAMTGRELHAVSSNARKPGEARLDLRIAGGDIVCRAGEVVGISGLLGSGSTHLLRRIFGVRSSPTAVEGHGHADTVPHAIASGAGFVPGERASALVMALSVRDNIVLPHLDAFTHAFGRSEGQIDAAVARLMELLSIRPCNPHLPVGHLSGGNQQKVAFARWLTGRLDLLLLDEPTNGVDIAAKAVIHGHIADFVAQGGAVILSSSDIPELLELSDAVVALRQGKVVGQMRREGDYGEARLRGLLAAEA